MLRAELATFDGGLANRLHVLEEALGVSHPTSEDRANVAWSGAAKALLSRHSPELDHDLSLEDLLNIWHFELRRGSDDRPQGANQFYFVFGPKFASGHTPTSLRHAPIKGTTPALLSPNAMWLLEDPARLLAYWEAGTDAKSPFKLSGLSERFRTEVRQNSAGRALPI
jgi:hypothetical protein